MITMTWRWMTLNIVNKTSRDVTNPCLFCICKLRRGKQVDLLRLDRLLNPEIQTQTRRLCTWKFRVNCEIGVITALCDVVWYRRLFTVYAAERSRRPQRTISRVKSFSFALRVVWSRWKSRRDATGKRTVRLGTTHDSAAWRRKITVVERVWSPWALATMKLLRAKPVWLPWRFAARSVGLQYR